jgi:RNA 2',3'-cyclic 3'-phosphodiesterase
VRLFVAVWPPDEVVKTLASALEREPDKELRWVRPATWHVTLMFLGSVQAEDHDRVVEALSEAASKASPCVAELEPPMKVLGRRVLCLPVTGLDTLGAHVGTQLAPFSDGSGSEPFFGHLTLARSRRGRGIPKTAIRPVDAAGWPVDEISLVSSVTKPEGPQYTSTATVRLSGPKASLRTHVRQTTVQKPAPEPSSGADTASL